MKADLDQLERRFWHTKPTTSSDEEAAREQVRAAVTELRAARRVLAVESRPFCSRNCECERNQAWLAYEAVGGGS